MGVLSILAGLQELALRTLQELAKTTTACSNAMNALDAAKADRLELHAVTIPAAGWKKDDHGCYIDLNMPGLTAQHRAVPTPCGCGHGKCRLQICMHITTQ